MQSLLYSSKKLANKQKTTHFVLVCNINIEFSLVRVRFKMRVFGNLRLEKNLFFSVFKGLKWLKQA